MSLAALAGAGAAAPFMVRASRSARVDATRPMLGTWVRVVARHPEERVAARAVEAAFAAVAEVDAQMSIHRLDSELARVNQGAGAHTGAASPALLEVTRLACAAAERTAGVYDLTVLPLLRLYGLYGEAAAYPTDREIARALERVDWRQVALEPGHLGLRRAGAGIDLGSIGKGWAVDQAVAALKRSGVRDGLVDAGGNVYGIGAPEDGAAGWTIGVAHPVTRQVDRTFVLRDAAVATSGNTEQYHVLAGTRVGHLFDARRGIPADGHLSATVQARDATHADLCSTVAFLLGPDRFDWPEAELTHFIG